MKEYKYKINGNSYEVSVGEPADGKVSVEVNGVAYTVEMETPQAAAPVIARPAVSRPKPAASAPAAPAGGQKGAEKSPLPGAVVSIKVKAGDQVKKGDTLLVLEAMKMENNIPATRDGVVKTVCVSNGDTVLEGTDLVVYE